jgi:RNA polymerase sigma factor (sigma-70 family)
MSNASASPILQTLRGLVEDPHVRDLDDRELLRRFVAGRDEAAFQALLRRHGPIVLNVCRGLLPDPVDAEDAFQATFLVFARKAHAVREVTALGSWLYGVAYRVALKARAEFARRKKHESLAPPRPAAESPDDLTWRDVQAAIHRELNALPQRYRTVLVTCYLEGKTQDEAANQLKLPKGTLKGHLERGRALLRARLVRRGLGPVAALVASAWPVPESVAVPSELIASTVRVVADRAIVPGRVLTLTNGMATAALLTRLKVATLLLLALSVGGAGIGSLLRATPVQQPIGPPPTPAGTAPPKKAPAEDLDWAAAEWVLRVGGQVRTTAGNLQPGDWPGGPFQVTGISLRSNTTVTDDDLARFKGLTKLDNLFLAQTPVGDAGLKHLAGLTSLESLYLPGTKVTDAGLEHLKGLTGLANLYLDGTRVTDTGLERLTRLKGLKVLYLRQTAITDAGLKHLQGMKQLVWVDVWGTRVTDAGVRALRAALPRCTVKNVDPRSDRPPPPAESRAAAIAAVKRLGGTVRYLDEPRKARPEVLLRDCRVTNADLSVLSALTDMVRLELTGTPITDAGLAHLKWLTRLETLDLYDTIVGDAGLEHLKGLTGLKFVLLKQTNVTDAGAKKLQQALPDCLVSHSPRTPRPAMPAGRWKVAFANGVNQTCEVTADGTASVVEPRRTAKGKVTVQGATFVVVFEDDRVERWTPVGDRLVVEHWFPGSEWKTATPVLGIADRAR